MGQKRVTEASPYCDVACSTQGFGGYHCRGKGTCSWMIIHEGNTCNFSSNLIGQSKSCGHVLLQEENQKSW